MAKMSVYKRFYVGIVLMASISLNYGRNIRTKIEADGKVTINVFGNMKNTDPLLNYAKDSPKTDRTRLWHVGNFKDHFQNTDETKQNRDSFSKKSLPMGGLSGAINLKENFEDVISTQQVISQNEVARQSSNEQNDDLSKQWEKSNIVHTNELTSLQYPIQRSKLANLLEPLNPEEGPITTLKKIGLTTFGEILQESRVKEVFNSNQKYTIFAPTNSAFRNMADDKKTLLLTNSNLENIFSYHICYGYIYTEELERTELETLSSNYITISTSSNAISVQSASLMTGYIQANNTIIYVLDKVLFFEKRTLMEIIDTDPRFQIYSFLIRNTTIKSLLENTFSYTVFLPETKVFLKQNINLLSESVETREIFLWSHIYGPGVLYFNNFQQGVIYRLKMMNANFVSKIVPARRVDSETLRIDNRVTVVEKDVIARNGVIHIIDGIL